MSNRNESGKVAWPQKTTELYHNHFDSTLWNDFPFRDDDIIISTYGKSGTTWVQQIVGQLLFAGAEGVNTAEMSPWVDLRIPPWDEKIAAIEAQTHRRFLKTHLPVDALVYSPKAKYIFVARDGRDVAWSFYNHHRSFNEMAYELINGAAGPDVEPIEPTQLDVHDYFLEWLDRDGYPFWQFWHNIASWWAIRDMPNLMLLHFTELKDDMPAQIRRIAEFLDIPVDEDNWDAIVEHSTFKYMREYAEQSVPLGGAVFEGGAKAFIHKGTNERWRETLTQEDIARYEAMALENLGPECAHWLATGEMP